MGIAGGMTGTGEMVSAPYADSFSPGRSAVALYGGAAGNCLNNTGVNNGNADLARFRCCIH